MRCSHAAIVDGSAVVGRSGAEWIVRRGYVLEHRAVDKIPLWLCKRVSVDQWRAHLTRSKRFRADPDLQGPKAYPLES